MRFYLLGSYAFIVCLSVLCKNDLYAQKAPAGWVYMYPFDEGKAYDLGVNKNHGQVIGNVRPEKDRFGRKNKALRFDGTGGYVRIPFGNTLDLPSDNFTFTAWVYIEKHCQSAYWESVKTGQYSPLFCKSENSNSFQYRCGITEKGFYFDGGEEGSSRGAYTANNLTITPGKWQMLTITYNGTVMKMYVNERLVASVSPGVAFKANKQPLIIGGDFPGEAQYFNGIMDDISIWEQYLKEEDIVRIYQTQSRTPLISPVITDEIPVVVTTVVTTPPDTVKAITTIKPAVDTVKPQTNTDVFHVAKGSTIVLKHVLFVQSKADLLPESYTELDQLVATLKQYPAMVIEVSGHTDNQGSRELNIQLSEERALKVKQYLVEHDIDQKRISTKGFGPDQPISPNTTEEQRRLNRRVEFKIIQM